MPTPPPHLATATDPEGRTVVLDADGWAHILAEHLEMSTHQASVMATVAHPDHRHPDRRSGRLRHCRRGIGPSRWRLVVIDFGEVPARVVTAFGNRRDPAGWKPR
jgi:hypothetical protein